MATKAKKAASLKPGQIEPIQIPPASNASEVPSAYSNIIEVLSMNHIDVRIGFNEIVFERQRQPVTLRRANIVMPVPAFLMMVQILSANAANLMQMGPQQAAAEQDAVNALIQGGLVKAHPPQAK